MVINLVQRILRYNERSIINRIGNTVVVSLALTNCHNEHIFDDLEKLINKLIIENIGFERLNYHIISAATTTATTIVSAATPTTIPTATAFFITYTTEPIHISTAFSISS